MTPDDVKDVPIASGEDAEAFLNLTRYRGNGTRPRLGRIASNGNGNGNGNGSSHKDADPSHDPQLSQKLAKLLALYQEGAIGEQEYTMTRDRLLSR